MSRIFGKQILKPGNVWQRTNPRWIQESGPFINESSINIEKRTKKGYKTFNDVDQLFESEEVVTIFKRMDTKVNYLR